MTKIKTYLISFVFIFPNIIYIYTDNVVGLLDYVFGLFFALLLTLPFVSLIGSKKKILFLFFLWIPLLIAGVSSRFFQRSPITETHVRMVVETNPIIVFEFLKISKNFVVIFLLLAFIFFALLVKYINIPDNRNRLRGFVAYLMVLLVLIFSSNGEVFHHFNKVFPVDLVRSVIAYKDFRDFVEVHKQNAKPIHVDKYEDKYDVVVLVVGESSSAKRWGLNGYRRKTSPNLDAHEVVFFSDVVSQTIATRLAVPALLSPTPFIDYKGDAVEFFESSYASLFRGFSFTTYWISNHPSRGFHDETTDIYMQDFDDKYFINPSSFIQGSSFDEKALPYIKSAINGEKKLFLVFHSMGSHFDYKNRYPVNFQLFNSGDEIVDSYDNSILYSDYVNSEIINYLKQSKKRAAFLFISDHGDDSNVNLCGRPSYSRVTSDAYNPAVFSWVSDPSDMGVLRKMKDEKFLAGGFVEAFMGVVGFKIAKRIPEYRYVAVGDTVKNYDRYIGRCMLN